MCCIPYEQTLTLLLCIVQCSHQHRRQDRRTWPPQWLLVAPRQSMPMSCWGALSGTVCRDLMLQGGLREREYETEAPSEGSRHDLTSHVKPPDRNILMVDVKGGCLYDDITGTLHYYQCLLNRTRRVTWTRSFISRDKLGVHRLITTLLLLTTYRTSTLQWQWAL
jgi:hypothetical protein